MRTTARNLFTTIRTEGALLPADFLQHVAEGNREIEGLSPESYHLVPGEKLNEAINRSWNRLLGAWMAFKDASEKLGAIDLGTGLTRERWLLPLFQELGYGRLQTAKAFEIDGKSYPISHGWQSTPIHFVGCKIDLDRRTSGVVGAARTSPHGLVQEMLNRSELHRWGFVSNGHRLRILRDNITLTRQAYVEFDLAAMFDGEVYADFVVLWLLCHESRVEGERPELCWLEKWSQLAERRGTRVLEDLRTGVEAAINALGSGFLAHPANRELRNKLSSATLNPQDYYRQLLRVVYRILFLFVAEDRGLLFEPKSSVAARELYSRYYSVARLRGLAERRVGTQHADLWRGLFLVFEKLDNGCAELALPALGSFLWSRGATAEITGCELANRDLLKAIHSLAFTVDGRIRRVVDYKNLGSEELGSIYEALLELNPQLNIDAATFALSTAAGNERKTTGSYYTPTSLVNCLLDSALDPVLDEAGKKPNPEQAILDLKVCDPAAGSGHFLIAAAHRLAKRLAAVRTGDDEPSPDATRTALRDVIGRCLYGVDVNPMAVELCKVSFWMEAIEPGKPLSFLDHHIRVGNSLLGATPEIIVGGMPDDAFAAIEGDDKKACAVLKKRNKAERAGRGPLFAEQDAETQALLQQAAAELEALPDDRPEEIRAKELAFRRHEETEEYRHKKQLADAWCAGFVIRKYFRELGRESSASGITQGHLNDLAEGRPLPAELATEAERLSGQYQFFHWHLAFPEVFARGGFDCVLGNPPWERVKLQEKEWFSTKSEEVMNAPNASARKKAIAKIKAEDPVLYGKFLAAARDAEGESHLVRNGGRFRLCAQGDLNTYSLFAELFTQVLGRSGFAGIIVPTGIGTDDSNSDFFGHLIQQKRLVSLFDFENRERVLFPGVYYRMRFCLLTVCGIAQSWDKPTFTFFALKVEDLRTPGQVFSLSKDDISLINPNSKTCPLFRSQPDAEIVKQIYTRVPILLRESLANGSDPWGVQFSRLFHMTNDAEMFVSADFFDATWSQNGNVFTREDEGYLPLYEGRMIDNYDHRLASTRLKDIKLQRSGESVTLTSAQKADPACVAQPRYWVSVANVESASRNMFQQGWVLGCMSITSATNARTCVMSVVPQAGLGNSVIGLLTKADARHQCCLLANFCSLPFDYVCKQKVSGNNFNMFIIKQLPVLPPATFDGVSPWDSQTTLLEWIVPRAMELSYTANDLRKFALDAGYEGEPFRWNDDRRFLLGCELDAAFLHLFGIDRKSASQVLDAFTIVQSREEEEYGEYRTKRVILEVYDALAESIRTGRPYETRLDPAPADPNCCHPRTKLGILAFAFADPRSRTGTGNPES